MHWPTAHSSACSWSKSQRKYWARASPSPSLHARPTRKATVPVPPDRPVVSVSRKRGRRNSSGANPRQVESAPTSWLPSSGNHSRRTATVPNGVASSVQLGGRRRLPPPCPPPEGEGNPKGDGAPARGRAV